MGRDTQTQTRAIAVGGLSSALCLTIMLLTGVLPFTTYALPIFAGVALLPCAIELGLKTGATAYVCVSLLSLFVVPDKEAAMMFIAFFGYYPIVRFKLQAIKSKLLRGTIKFIIFNISMVAAYFVIINLFGMAYILEEFGSGILLISTIVLGNICFAAYDFSVSKLLISYIFVFRKRIIRGKR